MSSERRDSARDRPALEHASEDDLLGLLKYKRIDGVARARADAHLDRCLVCKMRLERRKEEIAEGTLPLEQWQAQSSLVRRFLVPLGLLVDKLGALVERFGPPPLAGQLVAAHMAGGPSLKRWALRDEDQDATLFLSLQGLRAGAGAVAVVELSARLEIGGQPIAGGRMEVKKEGGGFELSGSLADRVQLPEGSYAVRIMVAAGKGTSSWEIPIEAVREPPEP